MSPCTKAFTQLHAWRDARTAIRRRLHTHAERDKGHTHTTMARTPSAPPPRPSLPPSQPHPHPPPHSLSTTTTPPRATQLQHSSNKIFIFFSRSLPGGFGSAKEGTKDSLACRSLGGAGMDDGGR